MADLLVAVPDRVRRGAVAGTLRQAGHQVEEAEFPGGLVTRLRRCSHDLLIVAASLLDGAGHAVPQEVGTALRDGRIGGVVVLEAWNDLRDIFLARRVGARGLVSITATDETLLGIVTRVLREHVPSGFVDADRTRISWAWGTRPLGATGGDVIRALASRGAASGSEEIVSSCTLTAAVLDLTGHGPTVGWAGRVLQEVSSQGPLAVLDRIEEHLEEECATRACRLPRATALAARFGPGWLEYVSRGHAPGAVALPSGEVVSLPATSRPIGVPHNGHPPRRIELPPRSLVLFPTDGLLDTGPAPERLEAAAASLARRAREVIEEGADSSRERSGPERVVRRLIEESEARGLRDDASLLVVEMGGRSLSSES